VVVVVVVVPAPELDQRRCAVIDVDMLVTRASCGTVGGAAVAAVVAWVAAPQVLMVCCAAAAWKRWRWARPWQTWHHMPRRWTWLRLQWVGLYLQEPVTQATSLYPRAMVVVVVVVVVVVSRGNVVVDLPALWCRRHAAATPAAHVTMCSSFLCPQPQDSFLSWARQQQRSESKQERQSSAAVVLFCLLFSMSFDVRFCLYDGVVSQHGRM